MSFDFSDFTIGVIGLGYVGLPVALGFAEKFPNVFGFDITEHKISLINQGIDPNEEGMDERIDQSSLKASSSADILNECNVYIITVPTPITADNAPDLRPIERACISLAPYLKKDDLVVFESTVYPGVTEEVCGPLLEKNNPHGLKSGKDFFLGYSPERINPGDKVHTLSNIVKVVSAQTDEALEKISWIYGQIVHAGIYRASTIKVAEAAKVIENTQRDLNIALMNECSMIFNRLDIDTHEVLKAAGTKWNFLGFYPGLVGGHCVGVDPYYLTAKAQQTGYIPEVILAGRRINDSMGKYVARQLIKELVIHKRDLSSLRIATIGVTFKENVSDVRNSRVPDICYELKEFGLDCDIFDPLVDVEQFEKHYQLEVKPFKQFFERTYDALIMSVPHEAVLQQLDEATLIKHLHPRGVIFDIRRCFRKESFSDQVRYLSL